MNQYIDGIDISENPVEAKEMYKTVSELVFPFMKNLDSEKESAYSKERKLISEPSRATRILENMIIPLL